MSLWNWLFGQRKSIDWEVGMDRLPTIERVDDQITIRNVRNFQHGCFGEYDPAFETRTFSLSEVETIDFIVVPFSFARGLAHTMTSFGFSDGRYITISVEARRRHGESYSLFKGLFGFFPLMYIVADERDAIGLRSVCRCDDVFMFPSAAKPTDAREMFLEVLDRIDRLSKIPERYNTLFNNCLTNIRTHVNHIWPRRVPYGWRVLFSGHAAFLAHELGLLKKHEGFASAHDEYQISHRARKHINADDFSRLIREPFAVESEATGVAETSS